jgi:hypothetical protein
VVCAFVHDHEPVVGDAHPRDRIRSRALVIRS